MCLTNYGVPRREKCLLITTITIPSLYRLPPADASNKPQDKEVRHKRTERIKAQ
jgi:hypothetical protein